MLKEKLNTLKVTLLRSSMQAGEPTNFCWHSDFVVLNAVQGGKKFGLKSKRALTVSLWPLKQATSNAVIPLRGSLKKRDVGIGFNREKMACCCELPQKLNNEKYRMKLIKFGG